MTYWPGPSNLMMVRDKSGNVAGAARAARCRSKGGRPEIDVAISSNTAGSTMPEGLEQTARPLRQSRALSAWAHARADELDQFGDPLQEERSMGSPTAGEGSLAPTLRRVCEKFLSALDRVRGERDRDPLAARAALRQAVTAYVTALRSEGISPPWVLESVIAFARGCRPRRSAPRSPDPVEVDIVRWSLAALDWSFG